VVDRIEGKGEQAAALAQLALQQAERQEPAGALTLRLAEEALSEAGSGAPDYVPGSIALTRAELGDFSGSLQIVAGLNGRNKVWPLWSITPWMVAAGQKSEALALARAQEEPEARAYALLGTASELMAEAANRNAGVAR
jgi:hypothetical protein